jgi:hypothetical protein
VPKVLNIWGNDGTFSNASDMQGDPRPAPPGDAARLTKGSCWPISDISPDQLDPVIQLVETELVDACLECHASGSLL